jgi:hypothetical protein
LQLNLAFIIIILSLAIIGRNLYRSRRPVVSQAMKRVNNITFRDNAFLIEESSIYKKKKEMICKKYSLNLPYEILVSTDGIERIARKLAKLSTIHHSIYTFIIDTYIPVDKRRASRQISSVMKYRELFSNNKNESLKHILSRINDTGFYNAKKIIVCSDSEEEIDNHMKIISIELSSAIDSHPSKTVYKDKIRHDNLLVDLVNEPLTLSYNNVYESFNSLVTPGLPDASKDICIGYTEEGDSYCLSWPRDFERHLGLIGPTGSGKTTLLTILAQSLVDRGIRVITVDPKGDLRSFIEKYSGRIITEQLKLENNLTPSKLKEILGLPGKKILIIDESWRVIPDLMRLEENYTPHFFRETRSKGLYIIYATQNPWDMPSTIHANTGTLIVFSNQNLTYLRGVAEVTGLGLEDLSYINDRSGFKALVLRNGHSRPDKVRILNIHTAVT